MSAKFKKITDEKGLAAEYHVNNTLHRELGAKRYDPDNFIQDAILFDGLLLPSPSKTRGQPFTEVDHLFISRKGVLAIETKSISGKVYGERDSIKWNSAKPNARYEAGLYDRGFTNPFRQNGFHVAAISNVLKEGGYRNWVTNLIVLVDADASGWEDGKWGSDSISDLFLSAEELVAHIKSLEDSLNMTEVKAISKLFYPHYLATEGNMPEFKSHHS